MAMAYIGLLYGPESHLHEESLSGLLASKLASVQAHLKIHDIFQQLAAYT
jgi:hypothetical protein